MKYANFHDAWWFLHDHPMFKKESLSRHHQGFFEQCLDIQVTKVNPANNTIDDDKALNTKTVVWLECGPYTEPYGTHDYELDCGGDTFEQAIIELAALVLDKYGDYVEPEISKEEMKKVADFFDRIAKESEARTKNQD